MQKRDKEKLSSGCSHKNKMINIWGDGYAKYPDLRLTHCIDVRKHYTLLYNYLLTYYVSIKSKINV